VQEACKGLEPGYQEPCVHVHETTHDKQGKYEQCDVPSLWFVVGIICCHETLQHECCGVGNTGERRDPGEASDPALHPGDESTLASRRKRISPVLCLIVSCDRSRRFFAVAYILGACNRLCGGHFSEGCSLSERASDYDENAPDEGSWTSIDESCL